MTLFRRFRLNRINDVSGVSGTGFVAEGVVFQTGQVVLCWLREQEDGFGSIATYQNLEQMERIHLHHGNTRVEWLVP